MSMIFYFYFEKINLQIFQLNIMFFLNHTILVISVYVKHRYQM